MGFGGETGKSSKWALGVIPGETQASELEMLCKDLRMCSCFMSGTTRACLAVFSGFQVIPSDAQKMTVLGIELDLDMGNA